jgi:hypothetical protein
VTLAGWVQRRLRVKELANRHEGHACDP